MGNVVEYTVQCVLVINIFNEKIFIFLWFWYAILVMIAAASLIYWSSVTLLPCFGRYFVVRHLELSVEPIDTKGECQLYRAVG